MTPNWWEDLRRSMRPDAERLRVAVYGSGGAPYNYAALVALWGGTPRALRAEQIRDGALSEVDVVVFPGGGMRAMAGMLDPLGVDGATAVREWVAGGGMYIGSCAGSFLPASVGEGYWNAHEEARELHMVSATLANGADSEWEGLTSPGVGTLEVEVADGDHWLVEGLPRRFRLVHYNGPLFDLEALTLQAANGRGPLAAPSGAVRPLRGTDRFTPSESFFGAPAPAETLLGRCVRQGAYNAISTRYGEGTVVLFGSHPEFGFDPIQLGWGPGSRLIANALRYQARRAGRPHTPEAAPDADPEGLRRTLRQIAERLSGLEHKFETLRRADTGAWLEPARAPAFQGRAPAELWQLGLERAAAASAAGAGYLKGLAGAPESNPARAAQWIDDEANPNQDYGFVGLKQLVGTIEGLVELGKGQLSADPVDLAHPYDAIGTHPYQILVSSYLSAAGLTASAVLACAVIGCASGDDPRPLEEVLVEASVPAVT